MIIYKHTNKINGKIYVGQTKLNLKQRWREGEGYKYCPLFYNAIQKYGWNSFNHEIIEEVDSIEQANKREQYWIAFYKSNDPRYGYNLTSGGLNREISEIARQHMSEAQKHKPPITEETRIKMSKSHKGKNAGEQHYLWGKHLSEDTKQKIRDKLSNEFNPASRKVQCIETGEIFNTVSLASEWCNNGKNSLRSHIAQ